MKGIKNSIEIVVYEYGTKTADKGGLCSFNKLCKTLRTKNICITRYSIDENYEQFRKNDSLWRLIQCAGVDTLPATYVNGKIEKIEEYPTTREVNGWLSDV